MSSLLQSYESLLLSNVSSVQSIESGLRNITWLLPGRFEDAEVASEGLYTLLNLVSSYHDTLLSKRLNPTLSLPPHPFSNPKQTKPPRITPSIPPSSGHSRYTRFWTRQSRMYRRASRALVTIGYIQLLVEMVSRRKGGDRVRWRVVVLLETIKTFLRFVILGTTGRAVLSPPTPQREYDLSTLVLSTSDLLSSSSSSSTPPSTISPNPKPTGSDIDAIINPQPVLSQLTDAAPLRSHLYPMTGALPDSHLPHPLSLLPELNSTSEWTAEIIAASTTLIHVLLLYRQSRKSPTTASRSTSLPSLSTAFQPFLIPLSLHLLARHLRQSASNSSNPSILLSQNQAHQDRQLATRFFLTGPMWVGYTRPRVLGVVQWIERIPVVGLVGEFVEGYLPLVDDYFYYTSS